MRCLQALNGRDHRLRSRHRQCSYHSITLRLVTLGIGGAGIEFEQDLTGFDQLPFSHMQDTHHRYIDRGNGFGARGGDNFAAGCYADIDLANDRPH